MPLSSPQWSEFGLGGGGSVAVEYAPESHVGFTARMGMLVLAPEHELPRGYVQPSVGTLGTAMLGVRIRPLGTMFGAQGDGFWIETSGGLAVTGPDVRPAIDARAGVTYAVGPISFGPFVGYTRVFETSASELPGDAQIGYAGIEIGHSFAARPTERLAPQAAAATHVCHETTPVTRTDLDHDGCPDADTDADTIADLVDRCPNQAEDFDGYDDQDGCPDPDNDADGIPDSFDGCPDVPETVNGVDDEDGCPDEAPVHVEHGRIQLREMIQFGFNSARIRDESRPIVRAVSRVLSSHPEYHVVYIEGHADEIGSDHYNFNLSYQRALSVIDMLAEFGIERQRLVPLGFGRSSPLDSTGGQTARAVNRRVEFVVDGHRSTGRARTTTGWIEVRDEEGSR